MHRTDGRHELGQGTSLGNEPKERETLYSPLCMMLPESKTEGRFQHPRPARLQAGTSPGPGTPEAATALRVEHTRFKGQAPSADSRIHHPRAHQV